MKIRAGKKVLTTGEVAAHCHVTPETVTNWVKSGKLRAYATPGRHRRIHVQDFRTFLEDFNMPPLEEEPAACRRVLIVDDEPQVARLVSDVLSQTGQYELERASDGFEAGLWLVRFSPDLIILDLMMPHLDGFKVCRMVRENPETRHIAILVLTAYAQGENIRRAQECGADYCMAKPFKTSELIGKVAELVHRKDERASRIPATA